MLLHRYYKVTVLFVMGCMCFIQLTAQDALYYYSRGGDYYKQQQYDFAISDFTAAIRLNTNYSDAYAYRGISYYAKKEYDLAIQDYTKALNLKPAQAYIYNNRGLAHYAKGEYDEAVMDHTQAITLDPANANGYTYRGNASYAKKDYDRAISDFTKQSTLEPNAEGAYNSLGLVHYVKKEYDQAIQSYTHAIAINPNDAYAFNGRGLAYYMKQNYNAALQDYTKAIGSTPSYADAYFNRALVHYTNKEYDLALQDYTQTITLNPSRGDAYSGEGMVYHSKKEYDKALQYYNQAISLGYNDPTIYVNRGTVYDAKGDYDLAIQEYTKAIEANPLIADAYNNRGLSYKTKGEYALSVNDFIKAMSIDPTFSRGYINVIEPLARQYRFADAAKYYNDFRAKNLSAYIDDESWNFFKKYVEAITKNLTVNNYTAALDNLTEAEKLYGTVKDNSNNYQKSSFASLLALKGYVLEQLDRREEAKQAYDQALVINTMQPDVTAALQRVAKKQQVITQADNTPPVITIIEPAPKRSITVEDDKPATGAQRIRGKAVDEAGIKKLTINNSAVKVEEGGYFETTVNLQPGINVFAIVATDNNANTASANVVIESAKDNEKPKPAAKQNTPVLDNTPVYHALLIAENDYSDTGIKDLPGTLTDMRKIYSLLVNNYNFATAHTDTLVSATKVNILESLIQKANAMTENDNLFVFYAGHGQMVKHEDNSEEGFLVPADAAINKLSSYISSDDLVRAIKYSKARHILFVADACFAGSLFRDIASDAPEPVAEAYKDKSRKFLASGNRQAVPDESEFIEYLRLALQENHEKYITAEQLIDSFKNQYKTTTHLQLQYYPIKNVDDLGGQFVFIRK